MKPKLLDLFCGAGGASMGYYQAGFEVEGVDIKPQPRYPFKFYQADALTFSLEGYDAYAASPPCQDYSAVLRHLSKKQPRLIDDVKAMFLGKDIWVIENVVGSTIPKGLTLEGDNGLMLCGTMFGLRVWRHRLFLSSLPIPRPMKDCNHKTPPLNPYNAQSRKRDGIQFGRAKAYAKAMGVEWMHGEGEVGEAIPPVYTEYIGKYLMESL